MDAGERDALEARIRALSEAGHKQRAATALLEGYGREILGFLVARLRDHDAADDVFSLFAEDLWRGLDGFRWQCSARVWSYTLARHAASRYIDDVRRRRGRHVPLSRAGPLSEIAEKIRTGTRAGERTEARTRIAQLRESLPVEDQTLLILRVNRKLGWKEIAHVMLHEGEAPEDEVLEKEAVRLRKRFQLAKDKLRRMAVEQGLVGDADELNDLRLAAAKSREELETRAHSQFSEDRCNLVRDGARGGPAAPRDLAGGRSVDGG